MLKRLIKDTPTDVLIAVFAFMIIWLIFALLIVSALFKFVFGG